MANEHAKHFGNIKNVKLAACCDVREDKVKEFASKFNIPGAYTSYQEMLEKEKLDGITNVTSDAVHAEVALAVLKKKIPILSEKPIATTLFDAKKMVAAAKKAGVINMINFSYRNASGLQEAAGFIRKGGIGRIIHVEASYLQSWISSKIWGDWKKSTGFLWRMSTKHGGSGVLGDVGCHIYDMTTFLCGDISEIHCRLKTFDKDVPHQKMGEYVLDANDSFMSSVVFKNGAVGAIHASRWATGHTNSLRVRVYGEKGAVEVDLDKSYSEYRVCKDENVDRAVWETVSCKATPSNFERFVRSIRTGKNDMPDFETGMKIQAYLHNSFLSDEKKSSIKIGYSPEFVGKKVMI
jgi:predicted dehydrogenase